MLFTRHYKFILLVMVALIASFLVSADAVFAAEVCSIPGGVYLEVPIGLTNRIDTLAKYITIVYEFVVGTVGILAAVMIMYNGLLWTAAAGNSEKISKAKSGITSAIIGLVIALGSYTLLYNINTNFVNIATICVDSIELATEDNVVSSSEWGSCPGQTDTECNANDYCQNPQGCACQNLGKDAAEYLCIPLAVNTLPPGSRCKQDSNCEGAPEVKCQNPSTYNPGICSAKAAGGRCTADEGCAEDYLTCEGINENNMNCLPATGRVNGDYCSSGGQCASGACLISGVTGYKIQQCQAGIAGDACTSDEHCAPGFRCPPAVEETKCEEKGEGSGCTSLNSECGERDADGNYQLFCVEAGLTLGTCTTGVEGQPCDNVDSDCITGLHCIDETGVSNSKCYDGSSGDSCGDDSDCQAPLTCIDNTYPYNNTCG